MQSLLNLHAQIRVLKCQIEVGPLEVLAEGYFEYFFTRKWHHEPLIRGLDLGLAVGHRKSHIYAFEFFFIEIVQLKTLLGQVLL